MKIIRVILAVFITLIIFYIARNTSRGRPETVIGETPGFTYTMVTTPKAPENGSGRIAVHIDGDLAPDDHVILRTGLTTDAMKAQQNDPHLGMIHFKADPDTAGLWVADLQVGARGTKEYYFIQIRDSRGNLISSFARNAIMSIGKGPTMIICKERYPACVNRQNQSRPLYFQHAWKSAR